MSLSEVVVRVAGSVVFGFTLAAIGGAAAGYWLGRDAGRAEHGSDAGPVRDWVEGPSTAPAASIAGATHADVSDLAASPAGSRPSRSLIELDLADWLAAIGPPHTLGAPVDAAIWPLLAGVYIRDGRLRDVECVLRAAMQAGVAAALVENVVATMQPADGVRVLRALRESFPRSGWADAPWVRLLLASGADDEGLALAYAMIARGRTDMQMLALMTATLHRIHKDSTPAALSELLARLKAVDAPAAAYDVIENAAAPLVGSAAIAPFRSERERLAALAAAERTASDAKDLADARANTVAPQEGQDPYDAWRDLGSKEFEAGNKAAAYEAYRRAHELAPGEWGPIESMIRIDPKEALPVLEKRVETIPDQEGIDLLVTTLLRLDRGHEAAEAFFRLPHPEQEERTTWGIGDLAPELTIRRLTPWTRSRDTDVAVRARRAIASAERVLGRTRDAAASLTAAFEISKDEWDHWALLVDVAPADVLAAIGPVLEKEADNSEGLRLKTRALRRLGRLDDAKATLALAMKAAGDEDWGALVEQIALDPDVGIARARTLAKQDIGYLVPLAEGFIELGRPGDARDALTLRLADDPDDVELLIRRCRCR